MPALDRLIRLIEARRAYKTARTELQIAEDEYIEFHNRLPTVGLDVLGDEEGGA